jgi:hypothetical protein
MSWPAAVPVKQGQRREPPRDFENALRQTARWASPCLDALLQRYQALVDKVNNTAQETA